DWVVDAAVEAKVAGARRLQAKLRKLKEERVFREALAGDVPRDAAAHQKVWASLAKLGALPAESREELERSSGRRPDLWLMLAADDAGNGRQKEAADELVRIAQEVIEHPGTPKWILDEAVK